MRAILSDIHGNLEALEDVARQGASEIYCLGDTLGYGPNPWECVSLSRSWNVVLLGHIEEALLNGSSGLEGFATARVLAETIFAARRELQTHAQGVELATSCCRFHGSGMRVTSPTSTVPFETR